MSEEPEKVPAEGSGSVHTEPGTAPTDSLAQAAGPSLRPILKIMEEEGVPEQAQVSIIRAVREYSGPLPPPEMLKEYANACEGGAERIMAAFEREAAHRQELEKLGAQMQLESLRANIGFISLDQRLAGRGQWIAAALAAAFGLSGYVLGMHGHDWLAGILFTTTIGAVFAAYVIGAQKKSRSAEEGDTAGDAPADDSSDS